MDGVLVFVGIVAAAIGYMALFLQKPWNIRETADLGGDGSFEGPVRRRSQDCDEVVDLGGGGFGGDFGVGGD